MGAKKCKTYSTRDSPVVTHPSTSLAIACLSMGERTGSRVLRHLWPYVNVEMGDFDYIVEVLGVGDLVPNRLTRLRLHI